MLNIDPKFAALIVFVWGAGSLLLVAIRTNSVKSVFFKKPSIIIGDFFILPVVGGLIVYDIQLMEKGFWEVLTSFSTYLLLIVSLILTGISAYRNQLLSVWWVPHLFFYYFMVFTVLYFLTVAYNLKSVIWWSVFAGIIFHQVLGIVYYKKFPRL